MRKNEKSENQVTLSLQGKLRQAAYDGITEADVAAIVKKQVDKAKAGDNGSLQFVMKHLLGLSGDGAIYQQINVGDVESAAREYRKRNQLAE